MYNALVERDYSYEGIFIVAVKTTGIFCRPTCTARIPDRKNVTFFKTASDALRHGYKPCKVCSPLEKLGETPDYIRKIVKEINSDPMKKIKDYNLRSKGIEPAKIRRWFKKNHGITFQSFQRMLRINHAFQKLNNGEPVSSVAYDSGYESLSGFNDSFKSLLGVSPKESNSKTIINLTRLETPIGPMMACATSQGICLLEYSDRRRLETELKELRKLLQAPIIQGSNKHLDLLYAQLQEYFQGSRKIFNLSLHMPGTKFQQQVWDELQKIPYGTTRTYQQQANALKKPKAVRAVANANGMNRIAIIVPCHRVIGTNGNLTGYGGGIWRKKWLLDHEHQHNQIKISFK